MLCPVKDLGWTQFTLQIFFRFQDKAGVDKRLTGNGHIFFLMAKEYDQYIPQKTQHSCFLSSVFLHMPQKLQKESDFMDSS